MEVLNDMLMIIAVVVGGAVAVAAFLKLATFSRGNISMLGMTWLQGGMFCALVYLALAIKYSISSLIALFLIAAITGLPGFFFLKLLEPSNQRFRWWGLYVVWLYVWFTALIGWRTGWLGLVLITLPALLIAGLGLFFVAGFLLPFPDPDLYRGERTGRELGSIPTFGEEIRDALALLRYPENRDIRKQEFEQRRKALRCLISHSLGTNFPYYAVIDEKIAEATEGTRSPWLAEEEKLVKRSSGDLFGSLMAGPGIIITGCDQAVVISTGQKFKGANGPGIIFTSMSENPTHIIDLRGQLRNFPVEAWTKDGIAIQVDVFIPFQIGTGNEVPDLGKGFPYRASDVFKAVHAQMVEHVDPSQVPENLKPVKWYDLPQLAGERIVRKIISRYEFDELYAPFELHQDPSQDPRAKIATELRKELDRVLPAWGLQRIGGGISNLMPMDEEVIKQRIEAWQADWARKIMLQQAAGQSRRIQMIEEARARAQNDIVLTIGKRIEQLRADSDDVPMDAVLLYFVEILEELVGKSDLRRLLPGDTDSIIRRMRGAAAGPELAHPEGG